MDYIAFPWVLLIGRAHLSSIRAHIWTELSKALNPSDSLVAPGTSAALVMVTESHQGPRDPVRSHRKKKDNGKMCAA